MPGRTHRPVFSALLTGVSTVCLLFFFSGDSSGSLPAPSAAASASPGLSVFTVPSFVRSSAARFMAASKSASSSASAFFFRAAASRFSAGVKGVLFPALGDFGDFVIGELMIQS